MLFFKRKARTDALTALSFGEDGVALARIRSQTGQRPQLLACDYRTYGDDADKAIDALVHEHDADGGRCTSLMDSGSYSLLLVEAPDVEASELRAAVRWRIKDLIDFHIDDAVIDVIEIPGQARGRTRMMYAVVARTTEVRKRIEQLHATGVALEAIDIEELALRNLAALAEEGDRGIGLLWFGPDYGQILSIYGGELFLARRIEIGADALFSAAQMADPDNGDYGEQLSGILDQVTLELQRSLDYCDSHYSQPAMPTLLVAPSVPALPFVADYLNRNLGMAVAPLALDRLFADGVPADPMLQAQCLTAIGAALRHEDVQL